MFMERCYLDVVAKLSCNGVGQSVIYSNTLTIRDLRVEQVV